MASARPHPTSLALAAVTAAALLLGACSTGGGSDANDASAAERTTTSAGQTTTTEAPVDPSGGDGTYDEEDCPEAEAVGEVVGWEVDRMMWGGGSYSGDVSTQLDGCSYSRVGAESSFDDQVTIGRLTTEAPLSVRLYDFAEEEAQREADEDGFGPLADVGDDAVLDGREVAAKVGDVVIWVEYEFDEEVEPGADNPAVDLAKAAIDAGLATADGASCGAVEELVTEELEAPEDTITHSGFLGVNDVEITTQGCSAELPNGDEVTIAISDAANWEAWKEAKSSSDFLVSFTAVEVAGRRAFDDGSRLVIDDGTAEPGDSPFQVELEADSLDAADAAAARLALGELVLGG